jgi:aspartate-semialdehyde dehydrogenase
MNIKVILTGATGMVGEGVLLECLENPAVQQVLTVSRRASGRQHPKLKECIVPDFSASILATMMFSARSFLATMPASFARASARSA